MVSKVYVDQTINTFVTEAIEAALSAYAPRTSEFALPVNVALPANTAFPVFFSAVLFDQLIDEGFIEQVATKFNFLKEGVYAVTTDMVIDVGGVNTGLELWYDTSLTRHLSGAGHGQIKLDTAGLTADKICSTWFFNVTEADLTNPALGFFEVNVRANNNAILVGLNTAPLPGETPAIWGQLLLTYLGPQAPPFILPP